MNIDLSKYDKYVRDSILAKNEFNIKEVNNLLSIKSFNLERDKYPLVIQLIKSNAIDDLKAMPIGNRTSEYLEVMSFQDQQNNSYIVTVYDSDEITQDPQVADIFLLDNSYLL